MQRTMKVKVKELRHGDVLIPTNRTVLAIGAGARTPPGKRDLLLSKGGESKSARFGAETEVTVNRNVSEYRGGPIPVRDVAGEWDRRDEEGE